MNVSLGKYVAVVLAVVEFEAQRTQLALALLAQLVVKVFESCVEYRTELVDVL